MSSAGTTLHSLTGIGVPQTWDDFSRVRNKKNAERWKQLQVRLVSSASATVKGVDLHEPWPRSCVPTQAACAKVGCQIAQQQHNQPCVPAQVFIIDEVSMVSAEMFEALEEQARLVREDQRPFGGIQLVLSGDYFQCASVSVCCAARWQRRAATAQVSWWSAARSQPASSLAIPLRAAECRVITVTGAAISTAARFETWCMCRRLPPITKRWVQGMDAKTFLNRGFTFQCPAWRRCALQEVLLTKVRSESGCLSHVQRISIAMFLPSLARRKAALGNPMKLRVWNVVWQGTGPTERCGQAQVWRQADQRFVALLNQVNRYTASRSFVCAGQML